MAINRQQLQMLQIARRDVVKISRGEFGEAHWRIALRNTGGVKPDKKGHVSAKALTNLGLDRMMGFLRSMGAKVDERFDSMNSRVLWRIGQLYTEYTEAVADAIPLQAFITKAIGRSIEELDELDEREGLKVIEALKAVGKRAAGKAGRNGSHGSDAEGNS